MALLDNTTYNPRYFFRSKHFNTVYRTLFHNIIIDYKRKRLELNDGDFLDLDFSQVNSDKIAIVIHGLEGSSNSNYVKSVTKVLNDSHWDVVSINLKGCSGEPNRLLSSYHSGKTDDLATVISFLENHYNYASFSLIGFSLGGNVTLKYLGEIGDQFPSKIKSAATISVPCDLKGSSESIAKFWNTVYMQRFLISLKKKSHIKLKQFPKSFLKKEDIDKVKNFFDFDNMYTAPAHGFADAFDYWEKSSSKQFIAGIKIPTLLITASDDPFLSQSCIPIKEANNNENFVLEITKHGGHVGFNANFSRSNGLWLENRIVQFLEDQE
jgi:predicted alpha/beta-fold hydrolase